MAERALPRPFGSGCLGSEALALDCTGACDGTCSGRCDDVCVGRCSGVCDNPAPDGYCGRGAVPRDPRHVGVIDEAGQPAAQLRFSMTATISWAARAAPSLSTGR